MSGTCGEEECARDAAAAGYCTMHYQRLRKYGTTAARPKPDMVERFWAKVDKTSDCWLWTGVVNSNGYGQIGAPNQGPTIYAHRYSLMLHLGMFDRRLQVLHHCDVPRCVNPKHLYLGTRADNMRDMFNRGRDNNFQRRKTHCKNGHEFTLDNTHISSSNGQRVCRACRRKPVSA